jgi:hypothetical protein
LNRDDILRIQKKLVKPFIRYDPNRTGYIISSLFVEVVKFLFSDISAETTDVLIKYYSTVQTSSMSKWSDLNDNDKMQRKYDSYKSFESGIVPESLSDEREGRKIGYKIFLKELLLTLQFVSSSSRQNRLRNNIEDIGRDDNSLRTHDTYRKNRLNQNKEKLRWILRDFNIIHSLISQFGAIKAHKRREIISSLYNQINRYDSFVSKEHDKGMQEGCSCAESLIEMGFKLTKSDSHSLTQFINTNPWGNPEMASVILYKVISYITSIINV